MELPKRLVFASLLLIGSLLIPHLMVVAAAYIIFLVAQKLPFDKDLTTRYILTMVLLSCIFSIIGILGYFIHASVLYMGIYLVCAGAIILSVILPDRKDYAHSGKQSNTGVLAILFTIPILLLLQIPLLKEPTIAHALQILAFSSDNMSHLTLVSINELNGSNSIGLNNAYNPPDNLLYYPQGWHYVGAVFSILLQPYLSSYDDSTQSLAIFYLYSLSWIFILLFMLAKISLSFVLRGKHLNRSTLGVLSLSLSPLFAVCIIWIVPMFTYGFQTQIGALSLLLVQTLLLIELFSSKRHTKPKLYTETLIFSSVLTTVATSLFWLFIIPISYGIMFISVIYIVYKKIYKPSKYGLLLFTVFGFIGLLQVYIQQVHSDPHYNLFNERGLIIPLSIEMLISFLVLLTIAARKLAHKWLWAICVFSWWAAFFSISAYAYQIITIGELRYYYYKSLYTLVVLLSISSTYLTYVFYSWATKTTPLKWRWTIGVSMLTPPILLTLLLAPTVMRDYLSAVGPVGFSRVHAQEIIDTHRNHQQNIYTTLIIGSCDRSEDIRATYSLQSIKSESYDKKRIGFSIYEIWPGKKEVLRESLQYLLKHNETVRVISIDRELSQYLLGTLKSNQKSRVEFIDRDQSIGNESVSVCPNRIR